MFRNFVTFAAGVLVSFGAMALADPYQQSAFPCLEDQALRYHPQFGPDRVGCINLEEMK